METIMKVVLNIVGVLLLLPGVIFFLQGINVLPGSFMTGDPKWAVNGGIMVILAAGILWFTNRSRNTTKRDG
jgi:hypothetical protein